VVHVRDFVPFVDQQREREIVLLSEGGVLLGALAINTEDRRAVGCPGLTELAELLRSTRGVVGGIEDQDDVAAA
jgi:hypothetical protein